MMMFCSNYWTIDTLLHASMSSFAFELKNLLHRSMGVNHQLDQRSMCLLRMLSRCLDSEPVSMPMLFHVWSHYPNNVYRFHQFRISIAPHIVLFEPVQMECEFIDFCRLSHLTIFAITHLVVWFIRNINIALSLKWFRYGTFVKRMCFWMKFTAWSILLLLLMISMRLICCCTWCFRCIHNICQTHKKYLHLFFLSLDVTRNAHCFLQ